MKQDIKNREDIIKIVDLFYERVKQDELLNPIFNDVAKINWSTHLFKMYNFWENLLFRTGAYSGRPFPPHVAINHFIPLTSIHFNHWLKLFHCTINELYTGVVAEDLKFKSSQLKEIWNSKFDYINAVTN